MKRAPQGRYYFEGGHLVDQNIFTVYQSNDIYCIVDSKGKLQVDSSGNSIRVNNEETQKQIASLAADLSADYYQRQQIEEMVTDLSASYYQRQQMENMPTVLSEVTPSLLQKRSKTSQRNKNDTHTYIKHSQFDQTRTAELFGDSSMLADLKFKYAHEYRTKQRHDFYLSKDGKSLVYFGKLNKRWFQVPTFIDVYIEDGIEINTIKPQQALEDESLKTMLTSKISITKRIHQLDDSLANTIDVLISTRSNQYSLGEDIISEFFGENKYLQAAKSRFISMNYADSSAYLSADGKKIIMFVRDDDSSIKRFYVENVDLIKLLINTTCYSCGDDVYCWVFTPEEHKKESTNKIIDKLTKSGKTVVSISSVLEFDPESMISGPQQTPTTATTTTTTTTTTSSSAVEEQRTHSNPSETSRSKNRVPNVFDEGRALTITYASKPRTLDHLNLTHEENEELEIHRPSKQPKTTQ